MATVVISAAITPSARFPSSSVATALHRVHPISIEQSSWFFSRRTGRIAVAYLGGSTSKIHSGCAAVGS
jgi:hypothetical protein